MKTKLKKNLSKEQIYNKILYYINYQMRSEHEVKKKLDFLSDCIDTKESLLLTLKGADLINDEKFIIFFIRNYIEEKKYSLSKSKIKLSQKGFNKELISDSVKKYSDLEDFYEPKQAMDALQKKYSKLLKPCEDKVLLSFLQRNGFSYNVALEAIRLFYEKIKS